MAGVAREMEACLRMLPKLAEPSVQKYFSEKDIFSDCIGLDNGSTAHYDFADQHFYIQLLKKKNACSLNTVWRSTESREILVADIRLDPEEKSLTCQRKRLQEKKVYDFWAQ